MKKEIVNDTLVNVRMPKKLYEDYKNFCDLNGLLMSKRIRFLIKKEMENKLIIKE